MIEPLTLGTADVATPLVVGDVLDLLTSPSELTRILIEGLAKSSLYLMIASGLTLIFGLMDVINFAHGAFTMYGAYMAGALVLGAGVASMGLGMSLVSFFLIMLVVASVLAVLGIVVEVKLIRQLYEYPPIYQILLTFGIAITLEEFMRMFVEFRNINNGQYRFDWASPRQETLPTALRGTSDLGFVTFNGLNLVEIGFGIATAIGIWLFLNETRYGLFVRAGVEDDEMAKALGINVKRTFTVVFGIGAGIAGAAGVMLMWDPLWTVSVPLALDVLLPAFVIVIVGGLGSFKGTIVASLLVGMLDAFGTWAFQNAVITFTGIDDLLIFGVLVVMLIIRPRGLFGVEGQGDHG